MSSSASSLYTMSSHTKKVAGAAVAGLVLALIGYMIKKKASNGGGEKVSLAGVIKRSFSNNTHNHYDAVADHGTHLHRTPVSGAGYAHAHWRPSRRAEPLTTPHAAGPAGYVETDSPLATSAAYSGAYPNMQLQGTAAAHNAAQASNLNVDSLMPASWRGSKNTSTAQGYRDQEMWAKYAPTKDAFDRYVTAAGSARLSINTRDGLQRNLGVPLLLRQGPAIPLSTREHAFNDSSFRQQAIYNATGAFPQSTSC